MSCGFGSPSAIDFALLDVLAFEHDELAPLRDQLLVLLAVVVA